MCVMVNSVYTRADLCVSLFLCTEKETQSDDAFHFVPEAPMQSQTQLLYILYI